MKDEQTEDFCIRLVKAGGGKVVSRYNSIRSLIEHLPLYREVTHVFLDNCQELAASEAFRFLVNKCEQRQLGIDFLYFKSLYDMIAGREYILTDWNILDYIRCRTPYFDPILKRPQERPGPSGMDSAVKKTEVSSKILSNRTRGKSGLQSREE